MAGCWIFSPYWKSEIIHSVDLKAFPKGQLQDVLLQHLPRGDEILRIGPSPERTAERLF